MNNYVAYSIEESNGLIELIDMIRNESSRSYIVCWGNHSEYSKGY